MAEQVVTSLLLAAAPVVALVGERIYPSGKAPQGVARPYVTYQRISGREVVGLTLEGEYGLDAIRVQVNCWDARINGNAMAVAQAVRAALHGKTVASVGPVVVQCQAPVDLEAEDKLQTEGARMDAIVTLNEAAEAA
jgi:hypothetical protein